MHALLRSRALRHRDLCAAILTGFALQGGLATQAVAADAVLAATQQAHFDIPAGPLPATLDAIAKQSGRAVIFDRSYLAEQNSPAIKGNFTAAQAIEAALAGKKLQLSEKPSGVLHVYVIGELEKVTVFAKRDQAEKGFKADRSDTATRSGTDLMDLAGAVTIITSKVLETQQATNLRDTLRNVSGIGFSDSPQGLPTFSVRGFNNPATTTNGIPDRNASQANVFGIERVEVLKGPQAILAGNGSLGGGVNVVLKKPSAEVVRDVMVQYGTNSDRTIAGDFSGAVVDDKRFTYRLIASSAHAGTTDAGYKGREDASLMPQLRWKDSATDLIAGVTYQEQHLPLPQYTFARRDGYIMPTPTIPLSNPSDGFNVRQKRSFYQLEQKLTPSITFISRLQRADDTLSLKQYSSSGGLNYAAGAARDNPNGTIGLRAGYSRTLQSQTSGDHYARMHFSTGDIDHKFVVGVNHDNFDYAQTQYSGAPSKTLTLYPTAAAVDLPGAESANPTLSFISTSKQSQKAVYLQDQISWEDWVFQLNWRRTLVTLSSKFDSPEFNSVSNTPAVTVGRNAPGVGVIYRLMPWVSLYANVANGFVAQTSAQCGGGLVPPISSKNKEIGAKFSLFGNKLSITTDAFQIDQSGTLVFDSVNRCYNVRAAQRATGYEFDLQGELAPGWQAIMNYTYSTSKDVVNPAAVFPGKPRHKGSFWTTYNLPQVKGLGIGLGVSAESGQLGTFNTIYPFYIPKQVQVDASVFYEMPAWSFTFGVKNIADRQLYTGTTSASFVPVIQGRNFMVTAKHSFN
ncbi:TonB-dependent siderophore receptor [Paucibacter sp. PLA-PC-4]|uniref:TonB-dependent siderophore receptor n=1 Tax=Paucibacter sp. PLA-PC-4 TaxID=2993655 RepID=UPI00224A6CEB|nr:TonB-dependent receptor [Paucibacter sp. PLA-PC-4]